VILGQLGKLQDLSGPKPFVNHEDAEFMAKSEGPEAIVSAHVDFLDARPKLVGSRLPSS